MDNLTHTLVGAALAESGLRRRTPLATAALVIGANLPDVDGLAYLVAGPDQALGFRRGWTHGVVADGLWPFVLAGLLLAWDRWVRRRKDPGAAPADPRALVGLSALAVLTHPLLDLLNTYGVRVLMPLRDAWFYGDTLFIVDPWVLLLLAAGWLIARESRRDGTPSGEWAPRWALGIAAAYVALMAGDTAVARNVARREMASRGVAVERMMAGPVAINPFPRQVVVASGDHYLRGTVRWRPMPRYVDDVPARVERGGDSLALATLRASPAGATFLHWARFPAFATDLRSRLVTAVDLRYTLDPDAGFGALSVPLPGAIPSRTDIPSEERHP